METECFHGFCFIIHDSDLNTQIVQAVQIDFDELLQTMNLYPLGCAEVQAKHFAAVGEVPVDII